MTAETFLSPRLVGERFAGHAIPLELLKDLAVLEEMVVEVAKWHYLNDHPERKRTPRGFTDGVALKLTDVSEGSAIPRIALFVTAAAGLFPAENEECFQKARGSIVAAINAAEHGESITEHLADSHLAYFDRIGRSLRDGEDIEFDYENSERPARLNKTTRRRLTLASAGIEELTEEITVRGMIPEADQRKSQFELEFIDGRRVKAPLESQHHDDVLEAFNGYREGVRVSLQGVGRFNRTERLLAIESVEHISVLESTDIAARLDEFRLLRNGWLNGKGLAPSEVGLDWLTGQIESLYPEELPTPFLYPTAEGGIQVEWTIGVHEVSLEISLADHNGEWHALNLDTQDDFDRELNLDERQNWEWIAGQIRDLEGADQ